MIGRGFLRRTAVMTVGLMIWLAIVPTLAMAGQDEDVFQRAKRLIDGGDLEAAIKLLEDYILKIKAVAEQKKNVAEAYYTLAKSYYMAGEDRKSEANLRLVFETYPEYIVSETNKIFLARVVKIRAEVVQAAAEKKALDVKRAAEDKKQQDAEAETRKAEEARKEEENRQKPTVIAGTQVAGGIPTPKKKFPWLIVGGVVVAGIAAAVLLMSGGTPEKGDIFITSSPTGAKVFLDDKDTGNTTNCTLSDVTAGTHTLRLEKASYGKWVGTVQVVSGQVTNVDAILAAYKYEYVAQWGGPGNGSGQFDRPIGVAVDSSGNVYVADSNNHRVQKFTSAGTYVAKFGTGTPGTGSGQLYSPGGVAVDSSGNVFVANFQGGRIQKFNSSGAAVGQWGGEGSGNGQFLNARGIALDASNNVYVTSDHRVQKFNSNGTFLATWGSLGSGDGNFNVPYGIAVASNGNVYVSEYTGSRIQYFSSTGTFIAKWGRSGSGDGQFVNLKGTAIDAAGNCYVADSGMFRIQKFTDLGGFVTKWGSEGSGNGQFKDPSGIAIDSSGYLYVTDSNLNRVQKFLITTSTMAAATVTYSPLRFGSGLTQPSLSSPLLRRLIPGKTAGTAGANPATEKKEPPKETIKETIR